MWSKFKEGFIESFVSVIIAVGVVYVTAWLFNQPANDLVGWMALGIAASKRV